MAAAATQLGASCSRVIRPSRAHTAAAAGVPGASSSARLSFGPVFKQSDPQRLFRCVAEASPDPAPSPKAAPKPPTAAKSGMSKGQIVRVDKEQYLNSIEYYAVNHPKFYKGIDYIYEDRGEILDLRDFQAGEYALIAWAGIPTSPAWLPTYMLIKSDKLSYKRR